MSLVMLDIDHFKQINDENGHDAGDLALKAFSSTVRQCVRDRDLLGRIGGEEFCLMLTIAPEAALATSERIRTAVRDLSIHAASRDIHFTTSLGVAHRREESRLEEFLKRADEALYAAKAGGRDRVIVAASAQQQASHG